ncbi:MAG: hypothetical protein RXP99_03095, partial [Vulcanisaeta sp.]
MLLIIELIFARYGGRVGSKVLNRLFGMVKYRRGKVNIGGIAQAHTHGKVLKQTIIGYGGVRDPRSRGPMKCLPSGQRTLFSYFKL